MTDWERAELGRRIQEHEDQTSESLGLIRLLEEQWDEYGRVMRDQTARYEEAAHVLGSTSYPVDRGLASRREVESYVAQLVRQQAEFCDETAWRCRTESEAELDRLQREREVASWA